MKRDRAKEVIVVGGGLAGLSCTMKLVELGCNVKLISLTKVKRSHSVCAQGGINVAVNLMGEDDSPDIHAYDTIKGGDFLGDQPPILEMCHNGPSIIRMLDRIGVPFNRRPDGQIDFRRFGGTLYKRTAFAGASTGQQLIYALDEQVRKFEVRGKVQKFEHHEFMRSVIDDMGVCRGIVMMDLYTMRLVTLKADAVVIASGGNGVIFKYSTLSTICTGAASGRVYCQGAHMGNPEFIQVHPTAIPGNDKLRLMSESARGEGGRLWVYGDSTKSILGPDGSRVTCGETGRPWYFLEDLYPAFGNLVPRDIASRSVIQVTDVGLGIDGKKQVYLDLTHLDGKTHQKLDAILDIYQKFTGDDPRKVPMKIFPAVHYSMGGLWIDWPATGDPTRFERFRQMTSIPGLFAAGECEFGYHGANRLGANSLLSCIYGGMVAANEVYWYEEMLGKRFEEVPNKYFEEAEAKEVAFRQDLLERRGSENIHKLHDELADIMISNCTVVRSNRGLQEAIDKIKELRERYQHITLDDRSSVLNQTYQFANQFYYMLETALAIAKGALLRDEFRGSHYKPEFPSRDDDGWLKTTVAKFVSDQDEPTISYLPIDIRHLDPIQRDYTKAKKVKPEIKNHPGKIPLVTESGYGRG
jgi:succinate dehydrogenase / fumarate reductase flavoprotein subunit